MSDKLDSEEVLLSQLKNPFEPRLVKWRTGGGGKSLAYIDARDVMKRLDDVVGVGRWSDKYIAVDGGFICELSIKIGDVWVTKSNGANNTKVEPIKGGISSALKRAAVNWGVGRYLYYLDPNKFTANNVANWPKWAIPGATEKWLDVAELEADSSFGMDEEEVIGQAINLMTEIQATETPEALKAIVDKMSSEEQHTFANVIENKTQELLNATDNNA